MSLPKRILFSLMALIMILLAVEASLRLWGGTRDDNVLFGNMLQHRALRRDPDLIWSLVPGFDTARVAKPPRHPWPETSYEFTINEHGRRGPAFTMQPGNGSFRVACFGDSTTFSVWVREAETWPRRLEKLCRGAGCPVEVVNCGVPGYSITQGYRDWRLRAAAYGADLVLIGFAGFNGSELRLYSDVERMALLHRYRLVHSWALFDVAARVAVMERRQTMVRRERLSRFITTYRDWIREARAAGCEVAAMIPARQRQVSHQDIPAGVVHNLHELAPLAAAAARAGDREAAARWYRKALEESDLIFERITPEEMPVLVESRVPSPASAMRAVDPVLIELNRAGLQAWYDGEYESAAARFERSLHSFPEFAMTNYYLAVCYQEMDKWDWAVRRFDLALQLTRSGDLAHQVAVRRIAHEAGVPVVDMPMLLELNAAPDLFIDAGHLGPAGYEIQARETLRVLAPLLEVDPERLNPGE